MMPEDEVRNLIIELRSATQGVGSFVTRFDHLAEVTGRHADEILKRYGRHEG